MKAAIQVNYLAGVVRIVQGDGGNEILLQVIPDEDQALVRAGHADPNHAARRCKEFGDEFAKLLDKYKIPHHAVEVLT